MKTLGKTFALKKRLAEHKALLHDYSVKAVQFNKDRTHTIYMPHIVTYRGLIH